MRTLSVLLLCFLTLFTGFSAANAQDAKEKSALLKYVEETLSAPNRQISLNGLEGSLSSNVSLDSITIADGKGVWLTIVKPKLVWTRSALLAGKLEIESLEAERIDFPRNPEPDESLPAAESTGGFTLPELPVAVRLNKLSVPLIRFGAPVFGLEAETSVVGNFSLADGALNLDLAIKRLDGAKGALDIRADYVAETNLVDLDVKLAEPADGLLANLIQIENRPPVAFSVQGKAPVDDLKVEMAFDVAGRTILGGDLQLDRAGEATRIRLDLGGPLASILPRDTQAFFGETSKLSSEILLDPSGAVDVKFLTLDSGALTLSANARRLADGFLSALDLEFALADPIGSPVVLPVGQTPTTVGSANISLNYDVQKNEAWSARASLFDFRQGGIKIDTTAFVADGTVSGFNDPQNRSLTFNLRGGVDRFSSTDPALNQAIGPVIKVVGGGTWKSGLPLQLRQFSVTGDTFVSRANGEFSDWAFTGAIDLAIARLAAFAGIAERDMSGKANLRTDGRIELASGGFDLRINGTTQDLSISDPTIDPLLKDDVTLSGGIARDSAGLRFSELRLGNDKFDATVNGHYSSAEANLLLSSKLQDAALVTRRASGTVSLTAGIAGREKPFELNVEASMKNGQVSDRRVQDLSIRFAGETDGEFVRGALSSQGTLDRQPVKLAGTIRADALMIDLQNMLAEVGQARISGDLKRDGDGLIDANLDLAASDISDLAALALAEASGSVNGNIILQPVGNRQTASAKLNTRSLRYENYRIDAAEISADGQDLFGTPSINAIVRASGISGVGVIVRKLDGTVKTSGKLTDFDVQAALQEHAARIVTRGQLRQESGEMAVRLDALSVDSNIADARLAQPTSIVVRNGTTTFSGATLAVGSGSVQLSGSAGNQLNLNAAISNFPLAIINAIQPQVGAAGVASGTASITGTPANPAVVFKLEGSSISVQQLAAAGISPLSLSASGRFADRILTLGSASARNAQNIAINASGRLPLSGPGLSLAVNGTAPLELAGAALASRGASASGSARFDVTVQGSLETPRTSGIIAVENGSLTDPLSNLKLVNIGLLAGLDGERISINRAAANLSSGGSISATGSIGLKGGMPADIFVNLTNARYTDGQTFNTSANGQLTLKGNLLADPVLGGQINLGTTEITVPENLGKASKLLDVQHVSPSIKIRQTLDRIERSTPKARPTSRPSIMRLDILIDAPNRIFVRGRGLDAELGGRIKIIGPVTNVQPIGKFELRRGRLSILGQRIDLTQGTITLAGDLDPLLDLTATTQAGDVEAKINLQGPASDLKITFSSSPELPEDEILANIIFGRGLGDLSPGQIVRLASIAAELTGGNSPGLVDGIRKGTGLDDLDVVQDSEGNAAVKAGKYITDNVYLGVQAGQSSTEATINLDITNNIKARGAVSSEGESSLGVFFEKDY